MLALSRLLPCLVLVATSTLVGQENYPLDPDSQRQQDVPVGTVTKHRWESTAFFPGTVRDYWIYVPAQYVAEKPAAVMVFQDGGGYVNEKGNFKTPIVFDNLIHKGQMPVGIACVARFIRRCSGARLEQSNFRVRTHGADAAMNTARAGETAIE